MSIVEIGLLSWAGFLFAILVLSLVWKPDPLEVFKEECRRQGMDFRETQAALAIRVAFVRLRRIASDLCIERRGIIDRKDFVEIINREAQCLHLIHGAAASRSFVAWANACPDTEILYPDAVEVHIRHIQANLKPIKISPAERRQIREDLKAAVTVVRR